MKRTVLQNYAECCVLKMLIFVSTFIVRDSCSVFGVHSGIDVYHLIPLRKRDVIKNIALSFPEKKSKRKSFYS
jgi:hypothetical protein